MKYLVLLSLLTFNIQAEPYRVKKLDGKKGIVTLDIVVPDSWAISKTETEYGDYLVTSNKSVYFLGTYLTGVVNDKNKPLSLVDFEMRRKNNNAKKVSLNGTDVYMVTRDSNAGVEGYTFSRFISPGIVFHASMTPYPEFKTKPLKKEQIDINEMLSKAVFPTE